MRNVAIIHGYGSMRTNPKLFQLYKNNLIKYINNSNFDTIITSGGFTDKEINESEAEMLKNAINNKINFKGERILEEKSFTTFENIEFCAEILKTIKDKNICVFCQNTHLPKIVYLSLQKYLHYSKEETLKIIQNKLSDKNLLEFDGDITFAIKGIKFIGFNLGAEKNKFGKAIWSSIIETHYDEFQFLHDDFVKIRKKSRGIK